MARSVEPLCHLVRRSISITGRNQNRHFVGLDNLVLPLHATIALQIADVTAGFSTRICLAVNAVEDLGVGEIRVDSEVTGNLLLTYPVDQITTQGRVVSERLSEMPALTLNGEDLTIVGDCVLHDLRELKNPWHEQMLHHPCAPDQN